MGEAEGELRYVAHFCVGLTRGVEANQKRYRGYQRPYQGGFYGMCLPWQLLWDTAWRGTCWVAPGLQPAAFVQCP